MVYQIHPQKDPATKQQKQSNLQNVEVFMNTKWPRNLFELQLYNEIIAMYEICIYFFKNK